MKSNSYKLLLAMLTGAMLFTGCASSDTETVGTEAVSSTESGEDGVIETSADETQASESETEASETEESQKDAVDEEDSEYFSDRDLSGEYDSDSAVTITLTGDSAEADSDGLTVSGSTVTITKEGTYVLTGTLDKGSVIVDVDKEKKVQLVLNGVTINSDSFAAIYVAEADKVFITLAEGSENTLKNGGSFSQIDDNDVDAVIYSKSDLTLNGSGSLTIESPAGKGISCKDELTITAGSYVIDSSETSIRAKDSLAIADGSFTLTSDSDGIHAENADDDSLGSVYIAGGSYTINAGDDGIHAATTLVIDGGTYEITAAEGLEATCVTINDGTISISASDDGINAAQKSSAMTPVVEINGGSIVIVMGQGDTDGVDANGDIVINGGSIDVSGNSTFDYDGTGTINGGTVIVNGEEVTSLPNQMMGGGHGDMGGKGGMRGGRN